MGGKSKAKRRNKKAGQAQAGSGPRPGQGRANKGDGKSGGFSGSRFDHAAALGSGTQYNTFVHQYAPAPSALDCLPELPPEFTGREEDVAALLGVVDPDSGVGRPVVVVAGLAGVGKTTLAHAVGHRSLAKEWFTGVLLVDLRGYDAQPAQAEQALDALLRLLGISPEHIPPTGPEREVLYRSHLAARGRGGERLLIIADNASSAAQVKPLLPPAPHGMIVTSRKALPGIGRPQNLEELQLADAVALIDLALREADPADRRVEEDRDAAERIAVACGLLPLALQIVAALLIQDPGQPLAERAERLESGEGRLDSINDGERDLRTVFDQTLDHLLPQQQDLFRMLSLNAGSDISTAAATALTHQNETVTDNQLGQLAAAHLIQRGPARGRWRMHDLLRDYAREATLTHCEGSRTTRRRYDQARRRLADHYVRLAESAKTHVATSGQAQPSPVFPGRAEALAWLDAEHTNLIATAHAEAPSVTTGRISFVLRDYLELRHRSQDALAISALALDTCRALGDRLNEPTAWCNLGSALQELHRHDEALTTYVTARTLCETTGDTGGQASAWNSSGHALQELHRYDEALTAYETAHTLYERTGNLQGRTASWIGTGNTLQNLHRYDEALTAYDTAHTLCKRNSDGYGQAVVSNNTGNTLVCLHRYDDALTAYDTARDLYEQTGNTDGQATTWNNTGNALVSLHRYDDALTAYDTARDLYEQTGNTDGQGTTANGTGNTLQNLHRYEEALTAHETARTLHEQTGNTDGQAGAWNGTGSTLQDLHRYDEALTARQTARALYERTGNLQGQAATWIGTGNTLYELRRYEDALTAHRTALSLHEQSGDIDGQAGAWNSVGSDLEKLRRYEDALTARGTARALYERTGDTDGQATTWNNTGNTFHELHRYDDALTAHERARDLYGGTGNAGGRATAWNNVGTALRGLRRYDEATAAGRQAVSDFQELGDLTHAAEALGELAETLAAAGADPAEVRDTWLLSADTYRRAGVPESASSARAKAEQAAAGAT
ncbi:tetratricopeptide repeat protein [Streptomyces anandii]|uniref:tetratricopeptide repeat protein n=1 Tax=Streptomyces anandii TaxID=285454 RepID=UPI0036F90611